MKKYQQAANGVLNINGRSIPPAQGNTDYEQALREVDDGIAEILPYVPYVNTYADNRIAAYASIGDQLDMQYHDAVDGSTTWKDHVKAVKDANPKDA